MALLASTLSVGLLCGGWAVYHARRLVRLPTLLTDPASPVGRMVRRSPTLTRPYRPTFWCATGHCQTIVASLLRPARQVHYHREILRLEDGGTIGLDWSVTPGARAAAAEGRTPVVIILPGVTGGSAEGYVTQLVAEVSSVGWLAVVFNQRGCGDTPLTSARGYCAAASDDCRTVVAHLHRQHPDCPLLAVGFSMGANILVKYTGEAGPECPLRGAVSLANPLDTLQCARLLDTGLSRLFYSAHIASRLKMYLHRHHEMVRNIADVTAAERCHTVWEFDAAFTAPAFGFPSAGAYYRAASSCDKLGSVAVPHDPIAPADPKYAAAASQNVAIVTTRCGGHVAWLEGAWPFGPRGWADRVAIEFLTAAVASQPTEGTSSVGH